jgi:hypothetical protein
MLKAIRLLHHLATEHPLRHHGLALCLYAALTAVSLDNLVRHFATAIPESWDYAIFYWNLWWVKYSLFNLRHDPMFSNYILYPNNVNLALHTNTFTLGLLTAPLQLVLDLKLIYNGLMVGSFIATGYVTFLFLRRHVGNDWLAMLGGALFAFTPTTIARANSGHLNLVQAWWLPLELLLWDVLVTQRRTPLRVIAAVALGLCSYLAWMNDVQFVVWITPLLVPYAFYTWLAHCRGRERLRVAALALVAGTFMLAPALIEPIPALLQTRGLTFPIVDRHTLEYFSFQAKWLLLPDPGRSDASIGQLIPLLTLLSVIVATKQRERWLWFAVGLGSLTIALGPYWPGTNIPLPYQLVHKLLGSQYRTPVRFMTPAAFALIVFISLSLGDWLEQKNWQRLQPWLACAAIAALVFDSGMLAPFSVIYMPDYAIYHEIGRDRDEYTLLEVPVGPASGFGEFGTAPDLEYYSYIHHKRILNGIVSRVPSDYMSKYEQSPLLRGLTGLYDMPALDVAARELADKLNRWDMRYVLVHRDRLEKERAPGIIAFLNVQPELCLVDAEGDLLAYRRINTWADCPHPEMSALPSGTTRLMLGQPGDERYVGPGWYDVENIGGPQGRWAGGVLTSSLRILLLRQDLRVSFNAFAYPERQVVAVRVNGQPIARFELGDAWQTYSFDLPASVLPTSGPTLIELEHAKLQSASDRTNGQSPDQRPLAAAYSWFEFTPR